MALEALMVVCSLRTNFHLQLGALLSYFTEVNLELA